MSDPSQSQTNNEGAAQHEQFVRQLAMRIGNPELQALRAQHPFIPIYPFPNSSVVGLLPAGVALDLDLPQGTKMIYVTASDEVYMSRNGRASIPAIDANGPTLTGSVDIRNRMIYVEEIRQFSVIAVNANTRISVACFAQL